MQGAGHTHQQCLGSRLNDQSWDDGIVKADILFKLYTLHNGKAVGLLPGLQAVADSQPLSAGVFMHLMGFEVLMVAFLLLQIKLWSYVEVNCIPGDRLQHAIPAAFALICSFSKLCS